MPGVGYPGSILVDMSANDSTALHLIGEIDLALANELEARLGDALSSDAAWVTVDLRDVSFMDSTGIEILMRARRSPLAGPRMFVYGARGQTKRLLQLTGLASDLGTPEEIAMFDAEAG